MWKGLFLTCLLIAAVIHFALWHESTAFMEAVAVFQQRVEYHAGGGHPLKFLKDDDIGSSCNFRHPDSTVTVVTALLDGEIGFDSLFRILHRPWPHPMMIYVNIGFYDSIKEAANARWGMISDIHFAFQPLGDDIYTQYTENIMSHLSIDLVHNATLADPFESRTFFWSTAGDLMALPEDSMMPLHHAFEISTRHPEAVIYHRSQPFIRHNDATLASPPELVVSQFGCSVEACQRLYTRYHQLASTEPAHAMPEVLHTQLCLEDPDACVILQYSSKDGVHDITSLWSSLGDPYRVPAFWNQLAVCTLVRNKNEFLPEWIEFHRLQGFDQFIIYDDASRNPSLFLESYIEDGIVTLVDWSGMCKNLTLPTENHGFAPCQRAAFADCQQRTVTRWLGVFDVDEFLFATQAHDDTVLSVLQQQHEDVAGVRFVGAVFGSGNRTYPDFPRNKTDMVLVTEQYTSRHPVRQEEGPVDVPGAHFWAHKEIARLKCVSPHDHEIHSFIYTACPSAHIVEFHIADPTSLLRMHHYQYLSVFQSQLKARINGNQHVAISNPLQHVAYNLIEDKQAAALFGERIRTSLLERNSRGAHGVLARGITLVLTSIGRIDLLNRTLETFWRHNTYPITRGIIVEDSGQKGIVDFARDMFDFPIEIIYNPDLGDKRHHKIGMMGLIACVDLAYSRVETEFIFHMEDDWEFVRPGFMERSMDILDADPSLIQVWLRAHNDGHPVILDHFQTPRNRTYHLMDPEYGQWHGFSFNPGLRRLHDYKRLNTTFYEATKPHQQSIAGELDVNLLYYSLGHRAATTDVSEGFVRHIGWGRTTDPGCSHGC